VKHRAASLRCESRTTCSNIAAYTSRNSRKHGDSSVNDGGVSRRRRNDGVGRGLLLAREMCFMNSGTARFKAPVTPMGIVNLTMATFNDSTNYLLMMVFAGIPDDRACTRHGRL